PEITGTPTPVIVEAGSITSGINFALNVIVPPLLRIPMPIGAITVDGIGTDWTQANIQPAGTDTQGDNIGPGTSTKLLGSDLKAVYIAMDNKNLYLRMDLYGTANTMFQGNYNDADRAGKYGFRIMTNAIGTPTNIELSIVSRSDTGNQWTIWAWDKENRQSIPELQNNGTVAIQDGVIELALPLNILHHPSEFTIRPAIYYHYKYGFKGYLDRMQGFIAYLPPPGTITLIAPETLTAGGTATIQGYVVDSYGNAALATTVYWTSSGGTLSPATSTTQNGTATATFTSTNIGTYIITGTVTDTIAATKTITVYINTEAGTVTFKTPEVQIEFGSGTLGTANVTVSISTSTSPPNNLPSGINFAGVVYNIELKDENGNPVGTQVGQMGTVALYLSYLDNNPDDGIVDGTSIAENNLIVFHWDNGTWTPLSTNVNGTENFVWAYVPHFSTFTLGGTPTLTQFTPKNDDAYAYPNPYKKGDAKFGGDIIWFKNVSSQATIKVYTIAGELVDEIKVTANPQSWKISDKKIASGVYIYTVTGGGGGKSVGKIGIVK
ncbi:MAG: Ig-like domain-containing protein, partial [bacterium]|nr:Ig-like domain-containing protein [bacterium]